MDALTVTQHLWFGGYGHRPSTEPRAYNGGAHDIFSFNTMEVVATASAFGALAAAGLQSPDPREDDPTREGIFRSHNCSRCQDGAKPCVRGATNRCEYPRARND
jgi:hypothetical protein